MTCLSGRHGIRQQFWQADEVAGGSREGEGHVDTLAAPHPDASQQPDLLAPAEAFLDALANSLAHCVARMTRGTPIDGGAPPAVFWAMWGVTFMERSSLTKTYVMSRDLNGRHLQNYILSHK